ncbi:homoserine kinase [candidate division KSB3 bacterium]|uniref:Homoserine kinase n=1 Tax=candidate division KSB3 bacterium TaxID=2044937 RepID=A0A2G6E9V5_9BACT|nr:MAG: homoserine kinase [candidate division KSB3 bacterium]
MSEWIRVFAPATVANVGPGFDILGLAISRPGDVVEVRKSEKQGVRISGIHFTRKHDIGKLPVSADKNTAGVAATQVLQTLQQRGLVDHDAGVELKLRKNMPLGSGLGSSGASAVAAAWAVNVLFGSALRRDDPDLILACIKAEATLSGFHADNVAPAMLGGFVLIRSYDPLDIVPLEAPEKVICVIVNPRYKLSTRRARAALPKQVAFNKVVIPHYANVAGVIAGILKKDLELLGRAIDDKIVEPARAHLIPGFYDVKRTALESGALGCSISGAGPSMFAITDDIAKGHEIGEAMSKTFSAHGLTHSNVYVSRINREGVKQID